MSTKEKQSVAPRLMYDPRRVMEHVQTLQGVTPVRLFAILFPLWDVETTATQEEKRDYELMERYIERGIDEGMLHTVEELAVFFGLRGDMVKKILNFLNTIGHVTCTESKWYLTPLGEKSLQEGEKHVLKEKRVRFYFDAYLSKPLLQDHYEKRARILTLAEAAEVDFSKTWGYRFHIISSIMPWRSAALQELEARVDKGDYNVPPEMRGIQAINVGSAYIPMYIIETKRQISTFLPSQGIQVQKPYFLVYTGIRNLRDPHFEDIINGNQTVYTALRSEKTWAPHQIWQDWLNERNITNVLPLELPDGTWRVSLPVSAFQGEQKKFSTTKVGDYDFKYGYIIQIWCDDKALRRKAALDRILQMVKNRQQYIKRQNVQDQIQLLVRQLQTSEIEFTDVRQRAVESGMGDIVKVLDRL